jgi:hypothetical protein
LKELIKLDFADAIGATVNIIAAKNNTRINLYFIYSPHFPVNNNLVVGYLNTFDPGIRGRS